MAFFYIELQWRQPINNGWRRARSWSPWSNQGGRAQDLLLVLLVDLVSQLLLHCLWNDVLVVLDELSLVFQLMEKALFVALAEGGGRREAQGLFRRYTLPGLLVGVDLTA